MKIVSYPTSTVCAIQGSSLCMEISSTPADHRSITLGILPHLSPNTLPEDVAIFPQDADISCIDVLVNRSAAQAVRENKEMKSEVNTLRSDLSTALMALNKATEDLMRTNLLLERSLHESARKAQEVEAAAARDAENANQLILARMASLHRYQEVRPKSMLGILGLLATDLCEIERFTPVCFYASRLETLVALADHNLPKTVADKFDESPRLRKALTKSAITKMNRAAPVDVRDKDAHLEANPIMLLSNLFSLDQWSHENGGFQVGEEHADYCALRILLLKLGPDTSNQYIEVINGDIATYTPIPQSQLERLSDYL